MSEETMYVPGKAPSYPANYDLTVFDDAGMPSHVAEAVRFGDRVEAYEDGRMTANLLQYCQDYIKRNQMDIMKRVLGCAAYADSRRVDNPTEALYTNYNDNRYSLYYQPSQQRLLTNSAFAPLAALYHYAFGDGSSLGVELNKLSFNFSRENLTPVNNILNSIKVGVFGINENIGYDFKNSSYWEWSYLGRVSLNLIGTLKVDVSGNWSFDGKVVGFTDRFDANPDASRGQVGELLTDVLRNIPFHTDYDIYLSGEHKIQLIGKK